MKLKDNKVYVVIMYRWGDKERHSYLLGVYDKKQKAYDEGAKEREYRGNKYDPEILSIEINKPETKKTLKDTQDTFQIKYFSLFIGEE